MSRNRIEAGATVPVNHPEPSNNRRYLILNLKPRGVILKIFGVLLTNEPERVMVHALELLPLGC
jgi:hypothetical protein